MCMCIYVCFIMRSGSKSLTLDMGPELCFTILGYHLPRRKREKYELAWLLLNEMLDPLRSGKVGV